jgi:chromosomal replication initiator protein
LALIAQCVAEEYGLAPAEIAAPGRAQRIARPRQVVHYLASMLTSRSGNTIGFYVGQCDHTTVHHGERRVRRRIETDTAFAETVARLKDRVMELHRAEVAARPSAPVGVVQAAPAPSAAAGVQPEHTT